MAANSRSLRGVWSQPMQHSQTRATETGRGVRITSGGENHWRFSTPWREESVLEMQAHLPRVQLFNCLSTSVGSALPSFPTTKDTTMPCSGPAEGSAG